MTSKIPRFHFPKIRPELVNAYNTAVKDYLLYTKNQGKINSLNQLKGSLGGRQIHSKDLEEREKAIIKAVRDIKQDQANTLKLKLGKDFDKYVAMDKKELEAMDKASEEYLLAKIARQANEFLIKDDDDIRDMFGVTPRGNYIHNPYDFRHYMTRKIADWDFNVDKPYSYLNQARKHPYLKKYKPFEDEMNQALDMRNRLFTGDFPEDFGEDFGDYIDVLRGAKQEKYFEDDEDFKKLSPGQQQIIKMKRDEIAKEFGDFVEIDDSPEIYRRKRESHLPKDEKAQAKKDPDDLKKIAEQEKEKDKTRAKEVGDITKEDLKKVTEQRKEREKLRKMDELKKAEQDKINKYNHKFGELIDKFNNIYFQKPEEMSEEQLKNMNEEQRKAYDKALEDYKYFTFNSGRLTGKDAADFKKRVFSSLVKGSEDEDKEDLEGFSSYIQTLTKAYPNLFKKTPTDPALKEGLKLYDVLAKALYDPKNHMDYRTNIYGKKRVFIDKDTGKSYEFRYKDEDKDSLFVQPEVIELEDELKIGPDEIATTKIKVDEPAPDKPAPAPAQAPDPLLLFPKLSLTPSTTTTAPKNNAGQLGPSQVSLTSFDNAAISNNTIMRKMINDSHNKMFPRQGLDYNSKMRKLKIDFNKNINLKGNMPLSAWF